MTKGCMGCHSLQAAKAPKGLIGPNLANVGARSHIAAGWLKNTDENLERWIREPQTVKKGVLMPNLGVTEEEARALAGLPPRTQITGFGHGNDCPRPAHAHAAAHGEKTGLWSWLTTVDHKRIGILYGATAFFFFLLGGLEALIIRIQLSRADNTFIDPDTYNQLFTMHGTTMIFLAIMPLSSMFFNYLIPLLIGARDVAFPRLNAFSYWVFLLGGLLLNASFLFGAAPDTGWYGYANLTSRQFSPGPNVDFWNMGLQILGVASLAAAVNFFVTIVNLRAPGMTMMRMPMFVWMSFITQILLLLAFPVIAVALILLMFDRFFGHPLLHSGRRRRSAAVAALLLDLRASRGLHPDPAGLRHRLRGAAGLLPQAAVRLRGDGVLRGVHRLPRVRRVEPPHVHHRDGPDRRHLLLAVPRC